MATTKSTSKVVRKPRSPKVTSKLAQTSHKKDLDTMSEAHRSKLERWEPMLKAIGAEHVWASSPRFRGRGTGQFYLAVKVASKDYRIVSFDTSKPTVKAKVITKGITSPTVLLSEFKAFRVKAKDERTATAEPAKKAPAKKQVRKTTAKAS
jgi:hypothetical protein